VIPASRPLSPAGRRAAPFASLALAAAGASVIAVPVRVLHLVNAALPDVVSGYTLRTARVLEAQQRAGIQPTVVALDFGHRAAGLDKVTRVDGVEHVHLTYPARPRLRAPVADNLRAAALLAGARLPGEAGRQAKLEVLMGWAARQIAPVVDRVRPQLVHAHAPHWVAEVARRVSGRRPWVYELRGLWGETAVAEGEDAAGSVRHRLARRAEQRAARAADGCLPIAEALAAEVEGWGARVLGVAPNVVDADRFAPGAKDGALVKALGLGAGPVVGYVGSLRRLEGLDTMLDALADVPEAKLLLVGDGPERDEVAQVAARRGLTDRVVLPGRVPAEAVPAYYRLIDVFWVTRPDAPVTRLVTPLKPLEAMATGLPVIASRLPALLEQVGQDGQRGLAFHPGDADRLARLTRALLADPERRRRLGGAARAWVKAERSLDALGRAYVDAFARVLSGRTP
jgi:glycosyltransferase involved in cell wall biosynthesis